MTFEEFQKKKKEGSLINRNVQSQSSSNTKMSFDEFKTKKQNGTLITQNQSADISVPQKAISEQMDNLWVESKAPNELERQNINIDFKPANLMDFVSGVRNKTIVAPAKTSQPIAPANLGEAYLHRANMTTEDIRKQNQESAEWRQKSLPEKIGTGVGKAVATPVAAFAQLGTGTAQGLEGAVDFGTSAGVTGINAARDRRIQTIEKEIARLKAQGKGDSSIVKALEEEREKVRSAIEQSNKTAEEFVGKQWVQDYVGNSVDEFTDKYSYLPEKAGQITKTVGNMLPSIANAGSIAKSLPQATTKLGQLATKTATMLPFMAQAAGSSTEQALNEGANLADATKYGIASGVLEGTIESISGGIGGSIGGKVLSSRIGKEAAERIAKNALGKFALKLADAGIDVFGEGFEEVLSTAINPYIQRMTYDEKAKLATSEEMMQSFIDGVLASLLVKGGQAGLSRVTNRNNANVQENEAQNQPQTQNIEQPNATLPTQVETAQNANVEQINQTPNLTTQRAENNRLSNQYFANNKVIYNNDGTVNRIKTGENIFENNEGKSIEKTIKDYLKKHINEYSNIIESGQKVYLGEDLPGEYVYSKNARKLSTRELLAKGRAATGIKEIIENANNRSWTKNLKEKHEEDAKYGFYTYDTTFSFDQNGKEKVYTGKVLIRNDADGKKYLYDILDIKPKKIDNVFAAEASNSKSSAINGSSNSSSINSIPQSENTVNTEYAQSTQKDTSNYISPISDLQGATEFVKKATIKDVDRLRKMLVEAEQSTNRIDLQFFAEEVKKKIEYLTKSQRYQKNKVDAWANKLQKTYGLEKTQASEYINEYIEAYKNDGDILEARETLLNKLNTNGTLGEYASIELSNDIDNLNRELDTVKRYDADRAKNEADKEKNKNYYKLNKETVSKLYQLRKEYQTNVDKAMPKILLTKADSIQLDRLLKDEISFDELPKNANVEQIRKAYDVKKPLADVNKEIQNYNKAIKKQRIDKMRELTENSAQWKDKKIGLAYARETQERNIADIAPAEDAKRIKEEIFEPIHHNEAEATRYKNQLRDKIKELNIDIKPKYEVTYADAEGSKTEKVSESGLVQLYGEGKINDETLNRLGVDNEKIKKAVSTFREIYNDLYNKTNDVLVQNGYAPVEFRKDYFPHFEETKPDTLIGKALNKLGFKMDTRELPTDIAGLTHTFRPGKKWVSNFLQRTTDVATYDAIKGFDSYLDSVADVIYHTDDIQNLRAYENALRYQHSDPVIKEQIDEIVNMDIANEMKQSMIDQLYANAENSLAHYVTDLRAYTDSLAGKKSLEDRTMEHNLGRGIYNITKNVQSRVSANMVGANISSALTNFIPITQATAVIDGKNLIQATYDTVKNVLKSDGFAEQSDFLINRRGSDKLYKTTTDKLAGATNLMQVFDNITSEIINRGRYYQNLANGMNEAEARSEADQMSGNIMADRSKGSMPTIFNQSSPVTKLLTAFQLEVNNQYSYLFKDIPKEYKDKAIGSLVWAFAKMFIGAWIYNELYEEITGRRSALDPINIVTETVGDVAEGKKASEVVSGLATEVVEDIPFVGGLIGGGRLPISSALPDVGETVKAGISLIEDGDKKKALKTLGSELSKPVFYILPPFGGGQLKKTVEGVSTFAKGGNYGVNAQGQETLKYPVEQTPGNFVKSALFGKWSTKGAVDYVDNGFKSLSVNQTESYKKAIEAGITSKQFYDAYNAQKGIESDKDKEGKTITNSKSKKAKQAIDEAAKGLNSNQKKILYDAFNISKTVQEGKKVNSKPNLPTFEEQKAKLKPLKK